MERDREMIECGPGKKTRESRGTNLMRVCLRGGRSHSSWATDKESNVQRAMRLQESVLDLRMGGEEPGGLTSERLRREATKYNHNIM